MIQHPNVDISIQMIMRVNIMLLACLTCSNLHYYLVPF